MLGIDKSISATAPHPAVLIVLWSGLVLAVQLLPVPALLAACALLLIVALQLSADGLFRLLRRTRWVLFSLLLVYGYATPGEAVWQAGGMLSPTYAGLYDGVLQLCRVISALAALSIVLSLLTQQQLIGGLYALAYPLRFFGLSRERIAVRLALTLYYAESAMRDTAGDWRNSIERMLEPAPVIYSEISVHATPFGLRDALWLSGGAALLLMVLL